MVTLNYTCAVAPQCEIDTITYTGTLVTFFWETRPDIVSYATGVGIGRATKRLKAMRVSHGGAVQKALTCSSTTRTRSRA